MKNVTIIIVNWNGIADTVNCLSSIKRLKKNSIDLRTIVVDNGSTNDSVRVLQKKFPWVTTLALKSNLGFTGGNNEGMKEAMKQGAQYIWLLNNDTLLHTDALRLIEAFDDNKVGIAGSKIYFSPGHEYHAARYQDRDRGKVFWYAGGLVDWKNMYASHEGVDEVDHGQYDKLKQTPFITGCSMMIKRSVIESIGYLDDRYYLYLEDLDYCMRAKIYGFELVYYPYSILWHVNAGSTGGAGNQLHEYYITRNRLLVGLKYAPIRTKIALLRESIKFLFGSSQIKQKAIEDAIFCRWGKQYEPKIFN